ncbi:hypothetical protein XENORESO_001812 [Xenotaenia resolanae]|uniref:Grh/CP2 DB domain-containing protein n=1 Tax=Xenotaenia resolanae TaxID=208358 RepID=A0ABV0X7T5_9TELE
MDLDSKRLVVVVPNEVSVASRRVFSSEDEAWKSYLENPLTAATKAMMSINGDEDGVAALGLLYDYYKVPSERKRSVSGVTPVDPSAAGQLTYRGQDMLDHHCQTLRSMPVNLSLNSSATEHHGSTRGAVSNASDTRGGDGKGRGCASLVLVKTENQTSMSVLCSGGSNLEEPREQSRILYEQNCYDLSPSGYQKDEQSSTPESTYEDAVEGEIYHRSPSSRGDASLHKLPIDSFKYSLEASMSLRPRQGEGPMAYLNRGQFYALTLSNNGYRSSHCQPSAKAWGAPDGKLSRSEQRASFGGSDLQRDTVVQSVIMAVFGEDKSRDDQLKNWKYWHSRQHTAKQRVLDIADYKESFSTIGNVEEIAYNAVSFTWDVSEEAKVSKQTKCNIGKLRFVGFYCYICVGNTQRFCLENSVGTQLITSGRWVTRSPFYSLYKRFILHDKRSISCSSLQPAHSLGVQLDHVSYF